MTCAAYIHKLNKYVQYVVQDLVHVCAPICYIHVEVEGK